MKKKTSAFKFQPFSIKQLKLLTWWTDKSPYKDYDMVIAEGAIRSGKTIAIIDSFLTWSLSKFENENFIIAGKSMGALKRNVLKPLFQILTAKGIDYYYNRSENFIEIGSNTYYCFGANNEAAQDVLQGLTAAGAYGDEVALFPQSFVEQMIGRCSVDGAKIFLNCNPEGPYHYIKEEYIDKAKEKRILVLHYDLDDNLTLSPSVKERYKRMFAGVFFQRYILGLWVMAEGVIYSMFDNDKMVVNELPQMVKYWYSADQGTSNATVFYLCGLGADGRLYYIDEYYHSGRNTGQQKSPAQYSKDFQQFQAKHNVNYERIFVDPAAEGFIVQLWQDGVKKVGKADNSVRNGIEFVSSLMSNDMFRAHSRCVNLIKGISNYVWDEKAQERGEDKPLKKDDDAMDTTRYGAYSMRHLFRKIWKEVA